MAGRDRSAGWRGRFGIAAERFVEARLRAAGVQVLETRYRAVGGEIDLVCRDADTIVFVEVKARTSLHWGGGAQAVGHRKRRCLRAAAADYLRRRRPGGVSVRFDVIEISSRAGRLRCRWLRDAFRC